jgi:hypothetical protein
MNGLDAVQFLCKAIELWFVLGPVKYVNSGTCVLHNVFIDNVILYFILHGFY